MGSIAHALFHLHPGPKGDAMRYALRLHGVLYTCNRLSGVHGGVRNGHSNEILCEYLKTALLEDHYFVFPVATDDLKTTWFRLHTSNNHPLLHYMLDARVLPCLVDIAARVQSERHDSFPRLDMPSFFLFLSTLQQEQAIIPPADYPTNHFPPDEIRGSDTDAARERVGGTSPYDLPGDTHEEMRANLALVVPNGFSDDTVLRHAMGLTYLPDALLVLRRMVDVRRKFNSVNCSIPRKGVEVFENTLARILRVAEGLITSSKEDLLKIVEEAKLIWYDPNAEAEGYWNPPDGEKVAQEFAEWDKLDETPRVHKAVLSTLERVMDDIAFCLCSTGRTPCYAALVAVMFINSMIPERDFTEKGILRSFKTFCDACANTEGQSFFFKNFDTLEWVFRVNYNPQFGNPVDGTVVEEGMQYGLNFGTGLSQTFSGVDDLLRSFESLQECRSRRAQRITEDWELVR
eukprot:3939386-Rhodomonas_salina.11